MSRSARLQPELRLASIVALAMLGACGGCATFSTQPVADNVVHCREQCQAGLAATRQGRVQQAHEFFAGAIESCPVDERARQLYAEALWEQGRRGEAINQMHEAARLSGGDPELLVRLGEMYLSTGDHEQAARQANQAIAASPKLADAWALEGDVLRERGELEAALQRYHRALSYRGEYPRVQFSVADVYAQMGRHGRSLATLAKLADQYERDHLPQRFFAMRGASYKALGRHPEAVEQFSLAAKAAPPTPDLLFELAHTFALCGETVSARVTAEQALALEPEHLAARRLIAQLNNTSPSSQRYY